MFLKLSFGKTTKKVVFRPEFQQFDAFIAFIEQITHKKRDEIQLTTVDKEGDIMGINDQYELEYFIEQTKGDAFSILKIELLTGMDSQAQFTESVLSQRKESLEGQIETIWSSHPSHPVTDQDPKGKNVPEGLTKNAFEKNKITPCGPAIINQQVFSPSGNRLKEEEFPKGGVPEMQVRKLSFKIFDDEGQKGATRRTTGLNSSEIQFKETVVPVSGKEIENLPTDPSKLIGINYFFQTKKLKPIDSAPSDPAPRTESQIPEEKRAPLPSPSPTLKTERVQSTAEAKTGDADFQAVILKRLDFLESHIESLNQSFMLKSNLENFNKTSQIIPAELKEPVRPQVTTIHKSVQCDMCGKRNIPGRRFKCLVCHNYDLCETCEGKNNHLHPMVRCVTEINFALLNALQEKYAKIAGHKSGGRKQEGDLAEKTAFLDAFCGNNKQLQVKLLKKFLGLDLEMFKEAVLGELHP